MVDGISGPGLTVPEEFGEEERRVRRKGSKGVETRKGKTEVVHVSTRFKQKTLKRECLTQRETAVKMLSWRIPVTRPGSDVSLVEKD